MNNVNDAEKNIVGICLIDSEKLPYILSNLSGDDFQNRILAKVFNTIKYLNQKNTEVDIVTVSNRLSELNILKAIGGRAYVNDLAMGVVTKANYKTYINLIVDNSKKNKLKLVLKDTLEAIDKSENIEELLVNTNNQITTINTRNNNNQVRHISEGGMEVFDNISEIYKRKSILGIPTGFYNIDRLTGGLNKGKLYILGGRPSMGKALPLDMNILTTNGWVKNKDIEIGDRIIGGDGKETRVIGIYPQGVTKNYKITTIDGREIVSCENHIWNVYSSKWQEERTLTSKQLFDKMKYIRYQGRISLPKFFGDYGIEKEFIIPPYVLGVLIGDGCLTRGMCYSKPSTKVFEKVKSCLPQCNIHFGMGNKMVYINNFIDGLKYIKQIGLDVRSYGKFIPQEYFHSSLRQRKELFNGLMDTDGYCRGEGSYEYSTTSKQLSLDVQQLAWSLGYNCKIKTRIGRYTKNGQTIETRVNYRVFINSSPQTILKVEEADSCETQCLHVDNHSHLFVIEDYIVTHNSAFAMNVAENVSKHKNVLFVSAEMGIHEYAQRMMLAKADTNSDMVNQGIVDDTTMARISRSLSQIADLNLFIDDTTPSRLSNIEISILNVINQQGSCDLVVIDYLQLLQAKRGYNREQELAQISRELKQLARKYNVPILALAQLSRSLESRENKRPMLSDLRESGAIEQDADIVMFVYRDEYYHKDNIGNKGKAEIIVGKNRDGRTGFVPMAFNSSKCEFKEL